MTDRYGTQVSAAERGEQVADDRDGAGGGRRPRAGRRPARARSSSARSVPKRDRDDTAGKAPLEPHAAEVGQHHDRQRRQPDDRMRERAEEEAERDEAQRDAGERREQRRARRGLADALGDERTPQAR